MRNVEPMTEAVAITDVKHELARVVDRVYRKETRVLVERRGIPVAAIVSVDDLRRLLQWEQEREEHFAVIDRMRKAFAGVSPEETEREAERSVAEARERLRQRAPEAVARMA